MPLAVTEESALFRDLLVGRQKKNLYFRLMYTRRRAFI